MNKTKSIVAVMLTFFTMGFVDMIGIGSNYVQQDLALTDSQAGLMPSLLFFWFLVFSVPTGMLMKRIGKKKTVMLSLVVTAISLVIPIFASSFPMMLVAFSFLGIGNAIMQTSLNPLVSCIVETDKLASTLTFGQFVKAIASFIAPYIAMWGATAVIPSIGLGWKVLFPIFALIILITMIVLGSTQIDEKGFIVGTTSISECFKMLGDPFILFCFLCIICHVGVDVGTNTYAPKILMARLGRTLDEAAFATSLYFIFRTIGCLSGSFILRKMSPKAFFTVSALMIAASMVILLTAHTPALIYTGISLVGFGNSNIFPICFSQAITHNRDREPEISGLMIMGLFGGTIFPFAMGLASDAAGIIGALLVLSIGACYILFMSSKIKKAI